MSMRKDLGRSRAHRPSAECLEVRQLLSATVSGTDTAGDHWTLTLKGKGALQVVKQDDSSGSPGALESATEINSITVSGTDPRSSILIGTVTPAAGSDGRVFFNTLNEIPNRSDLSASGLGLEAINMPDFWLGYTGSAKATDTSAVAEINIPDGVNSLRFGGVDTTKFFGTDATQGPTQDAQADQFLVKLGLPYAIGTSIVVNKVISYSEAAAPSTGSTTNSATQKSVVFNVAGRINLFQADEVDGSTTNSVPANGFNGGTIVGSFADPTSGVVGAIGFVRVGGNATNFSVVTTNIMSNFYVGGETNNVASLTPNGARNFYFGKGFDTTSILTHSLENLYSNRGSLNSSITSERQIGNLQIGGDVANGTFLSGYQAGLATTASLVQQNLSNASNTTAATISLPTAQANGHITTFIAGNVTNSIFAASDLPISQVQDPTVQTFGNASDAFLPLGKIIARVEGSIDNSTATPDFPNKAFYALTVDQSHVPVVPPNVVEEPLPAPATPITLPGIPKVFPASTSTNATDKAKTTKTTGSGAGSTNIAVTSVTNGAKTPKAPATKK